VVNAECLHSEQDNSANSGEHGTDRRILAEGLIGYIAATPPDLLSLLTAIMRKDTYKDAQRSLGLSRHQLDCAMRR
jgi:hypothetical protein